MGGGCGASGASREPRGVGRRSFARRRRLRAEHARMRARGNCNGSLHLQRIVAGPGGVLFSSHREAEKVCILLRGGGACSRYGTEAVPDAERRSRPPASFTSSLPVAATVA